MTSEERVDRIRELTANPPRVKRHGWDLFWYRFMQACSIIAVASLIIAVTTLLRIASVAYCINTNLGLRGSISGLQADANNAYVTADHNYNLIFNRALIARPTTPAAKRVVLLKLEAATNAKNAAYTNLKATNDRIKAIAAAHPLGKC